MVPFRLANMKCAAPPPPFFTGKEEVLVLLTCPVGPCGPDAVVGMATVSGTLATVVLSVTAYRVAVLVPWFDDQKGLVGLCARPHGFFRAVSVIAASPERSETRFV